MKKLVFSFAAFLGLSVSAMAQSHDVQITINPVAQIRVVDGANSTTPAAHTFIVGNATTPGGIPVITPGTNATVYLQYTTIKTGATPSGKVQATSGLTIPSGLELKATVVAPSAAPAVGTTGSGASNVVLSTTAADVITGVGSGYTGNGNGNGATVSYALSISDMASLTVQTASTHTITYTLASL